MRTFIPGFLLFSICLLFGRWYYVCEVKQLCGGAVEHVQMEIPRPATLALRSDGEIVLEKYDEFLFRTDSVEAVLNENNQLFLKAVAEYLFKNPEQELSISGRFLRSERSAPSGFFDNIGLARGSYVEELLAGYGLSKDRVFLNYVEIDADSLFAPLAFNANSPKADAYPKLQFSFEDMTYVDANFARNSADFRPKAGFVSYADSVKLFLDVNPDYRLLITGHTDSVASLEFNEDLGMARAKAAREYFLELGVSNKIEVASKGETEPIAPNSNPDGSENKDGTQRNRRVNFKLESTLEDN
ncbi:MAG: OmpA family protein [Saprospiraceae bacterium]|nr:OmpA family protein [Saprospiraceae bacterium]